MSTRLLLEDDRKIDTVSDEGMLMQNRAVNLLRGLLFLLSLIQ